MIGGHRLPWKTESDVPFVVLVRIYFDYAKFKSLCNLQAYISVVITWTASVVVGYALTWPTVYSPVDLRYLSMVLELEMA